MDLKQLRKEKALDKEMKVVQKQEQKLLSARASLWCLRREEVL